MQNLKLDYIVDIIKSKKAKLVGIQLPDGLKRKSNEMVTYIESKTNARAITSANPCYGACDIDEKLKTISDLLIHFGHSPMYEDDKMIFVEVRSDVEISKVVKEAAKHLSGSIGLITTIQHVHKLEEAKQILLDLGEDVVVEKGEPPIKHPGQVLGCNFSACPSDCDEILFIGTGEFHAIGAALYSRKKVTIADPFLGVRFVHPDEIIQQRHVKIAKAMDADSIGIIIGAKSGQCNVDTAFKLREMADSRYDTYLLLMDEITNDKLMQFDIDAFVNTACPRVAMEMDAKPMLTPSEFEILLGERKWDEICI